MRVYKGEPTKLAGAAPDISTELLHFVKKQYALLVKYRVRLGGSWNLNVLVNDHAADKYVVRVYGPWVTQERLKEIQRIRQTLTSKDIPTPELRPTVDGALSSVFEDCANHYVVEVERYVEGTPMQTWPQQCVGMHKFGQLHTLMAELDSQIPPPVANHLPEELALAATEDVLSIIHAWEPTPQEESYADAVDELVRLLPVMDLPVQLVHGDFKDNNLVFRGEELVAVLDFDFMGVRPRIDDLALPLHTMLQCGKPLSKIRQLVDLYDSRCQVPLSTQERQALPYAMARMSLCYLQYMMIPGDEAYRLHCRREFNESRGPACVWWRDMLKDEAFREGGFV